MANCRDCKHSVFDEVWGEYKCKKKVIRLYDLDRFKDCEEYEQDKTKTKENEQ